MKTIQSFYMVLAAAVLIVTAACTAVPASPARVTQAPLQPTPAQETPAPSPLPAQGQASSGSAPCSRLIPPDEVNSLLNQAEAALNEQAASGSTTCTWQYTPAGGAQTSTFQIQVWVGSSALQEWQAARQSEVAAQPAGLVVISIDGLGDENYTWVESSGGQRVIYVRRGSQALGMHFQTADILFLGTESGIIDMAQRIFERMNS